MGQVFARRRSVMESALADHGLDVAGRGVFGGSSIWMQAPDHIDMGQIDNALRQSGVLIEPGHPFFHGTDRPRNFYRLAYSSIPSDRIPQGIAHIARELASASGQGS
jgi:GntR family transcriptional regulator/MocR family aminotransferase